jgi:signal transduction histidine kinase
VLLNLVSNALKFTFSGEIKAKVSIQQGQSNSSDNQDKTMMIIDVIDTGIGISEENQTKLFKIFGKLKSASKYN